MGLLKSFIILTFIMVETLSHTIIVTAICLTVSLKFFSSQIKLKDNTDVCGFGLLSSNVLIIEP